MSFNPRIMAIALAMPLMSNPSIGADNPANANGSVRCVSIKDIRRTEVVDDQNILFHLRGKKTYNNHLPQTCIGLAQAKTFKYETSLSELCSVDIISVLDNVAGKFLVGASCGLGMFEPVESTKKNPAH